MTRILVELAPGVRLCIEPERWAKLGPDTRKGLAESGTEQRRHLATTMKKPAAAFPPGKLCIDTHECGDDCPTEVTPWH